MRVNNGFITALTILAGLTPGLFAGNTLWEQAMDHAALGYADAAHLMIMESWENDRDGVQDSRKVIEVGRDENTWKWKVLTAEEDGKDTTARERRKAERQQEDGSNRQYIHPMFDPEKASGLTLNPRETTAFVRGMECLIYDFRLENSWPLGPGKPKEIVEEGIVLIAMENGMPLRIDSSVVEGPRLLRSMTYRLTAHPGPGDDWRVDRMDMEFVGKMIIYKAGGVSISFEYQDS